MKVLLNSRTALAFALCVVLLVLQTNCSSTGAIMRIDAILARFREQDFQRDVANVLLSEMRDIDVIHAGNSRMGSGVDVYFQIREPSLDEIESATADITKLSGDEKMLLLYQWWVTDSPRIDQLSFDIIDFEVYAPRRANTTEASISVINVFQTTKDTASVVVELKTDSAAPSSFVITTPTLILSFFLSFVVVVWNRLHPPLRAF
eukprot:TRINITY_DN14249_c0_g1_i1.p1 TRINITY_DN14249_c0_g1~~TRINITY_DN14249_c0_g1_i1.p1  ORF type:complete len:214 (+),score=72.16 TRINITY_DN14249_c0_g1_i1:30-644(+)